MAGGRLERRPRADLPGWRHTRDAGGCRAPYLLPGLTRHEGQSQITELGRGFADPFESTLNRIVCFLVLLERCHVHAGDATLNRLRVFYDVFQAAGGFIRRQGCDPGRPLFENASCAPAPR